MNRRLIILVALSAWLAAGCAPKPAAQPRQWTEADKQAFREAWGVEQPSFATHPRSVPVVHGPAPLAYLTEQACEISVSDSIGGSWGPVNVPGRTVVRVAEQTGIAVGSVRLHPGPLPEGRTYTIHLLLPGDAGWTNGTQEGPKK